MNKQNQIIQLKQLSKYSRPRLGRGCINTCLVFNCNLDITVLGVSPVKKSGQILNLKRAYASRSSSRSGNVTLTNEVKVQQDLLRELMVQKVQSSPNRVAVGGVPFGKFAK